MKNLGKGESILNTKTNLKSNPDPKIQALRLKFLIFTKDLFIFEIFRILLLKMSSHEMTISGVKLKFPKKIILEHVLHFVFGVKAHCLKKSNIFDIYFKL